MGEKSMYYEFAKAMFKRLCDLINGDIRYEIYANIDSVIFKTKFKEFDFNFAIGHVSEHMLTGDIDSVVKEFETKYRKAINNAFFKQEKNRKEEGYGVREA